MAFWNLHKANHVVQATDNTKEKETQARERLIRIARQNPAESLTELGSSSKGITAHEAKIRRNKYESADISTHRRKNPLIHLWQCYANPFSLLLSLLAFIMFLTDDHQGATIIFIMVVLSTLLRFIQEARSNRAADAISSMVRNTIAVLRAPHETDAELDADDAEEGETVKGALGKEIPISLLVPGDVVYLSAGDMIPADVRILTSKDLFISQGALTGESIPVEKMNDLAPETDEKMNLFDYRNLSFMGTNVVSGSATALVINTGSFTFFGKLAKQVLHEKPLVSDFQRGIKKVSYLLIQFMMVMVPIVLVINGFTKGDWLEASLFALSVAVGLTPEMLPMIVTATLAKGSVFLARKKVIVKNLESIQSFGAMDVLCTDKTGTLTQDKIVLERYLDINDDETPRVLGLGYLNSHYQTGLRNLLDVAILAHEEEVSHFLNLETDFAKVDEVPFDFVRKRMSVIVSQKDKSHLLICKGASEEILKVSTTAMDGDKIIALDDEKRGQIKTLLKKLSGHGLRVVAVATKEFDLDHTVFSVKDEADLTLAGFIAFLDPPKESTAPALRALHASGVDVKILTGDNEAVTKTVCRQVNLLVTGILLGSQIDEMNDDELGQWVDETNVFAKLSPLHKERIVKALQKRGHVVGYMGDGINDAPALKAADIGISVDSAVDIAKESADLILLEKSLMVLEDGIIEGRRTFGNMMKYIRMTASSNFGNVFSVMVASIFLPFLPMLPIQLLTQNLLYDISQTTIPFDKMDKEDVANPQTWNPRSLARFMVFFGPISSIFDIITYVVMWYVFKANTVESASLFQSGWFVEGLLSQTLIVHMIRTRKIPFIGSISAVPLLIMTGVIIVIGLFLPQTVLAPYFNMVPLPMIYYAWLAGILLGYVVLTQAMKNLYVKLWGWH